jgi:hypothetical protein
MLPTSESFKKLPKSKQPPNRQKIAQSGHPASDQNFLSWNRIFWRHLPPVSLFTTYFNFPK